MRSDDEFYGGPLPNRAQQAVNDYLNGNWGNFRNFVKTCKKKEMLEAIEDYSLRLLPPAPFIARMHEILTPGSIY